MINDIGKRGKIEFHNNENTFEVSRWNVNKPKLSIISNLRVRFVSVSRWKIHRMRSGLVNSRRCLIITEHGSNRAIGFSSAGSVTI